MIGADDRAALNRAADIFARLPTVMVAERRRRGLSQQAAAHQIGVDRQSISHWESRRSWPQGRHVPAVLRWLARPVTAGRRSITGYRPVPAAHGAMLTSMAACPPAPDSDMPGRRLTGWATPEGRARAVEGSSELRGARRAAADTTGSPDGQVRALAWLLGIKKPALSAYTCSRLAAGAAGAGSWAGAVWWLVRAGVGRVRAEAVAGLVWPGQVPAGGVAGEGPAVRGRPRRRPVDVGSGAAGSTK